MLVSHGNYCHKCSAVAEMGDRFATIDKGSRQPCNKHTMASHM